MISARTKIAELSEISTARQKRFSSSRLRDALLCSAYGTGRDADDRQGYDGGDRATIVAVLIGRHRSKAP